MTQPAPQSLISTLVIVAALGYFVDVYDLVLFSIVRVPSLMDLGLSGHALLNQGMLLLNLQMAGMLIGGILWGILGDKKGRVSVLFGSIFLYSVANICNAFVHSIPAYGFWRLVAGLGLAGELGAGITLVTEALPKDQRGYGTMLIAGIGIMGAVVACLIAEFFFWRVNYLIGGGLGLLLLVLRLGVYESGLYARLAGQNVIRGRFFSLFTDGKRFVRYVRCILAGLPIWFVIGILVTFAPEFARTLNVADPIVASKAVMFTYIGVVAGDFISGALSQLLRRRRQVLLTYVFLCAVCMLIYFHLEEVSGWIFYSVCLLMGQAIGYWAVLVTSAAEQFGTNLRSTVTTSVPNFIRGSLVPLTLLFQFFKNRLGILSAGQCVAAFCVIVAALAVLGLEETYGKDMDFVEIL